jgi:tetratricopeptide (TPR) repeat protein
LKRAEPAIPPRPKDSAKDGLIRLPFGVARFRFGAFALVDVDLSPDVFPLAAFRKIAAQPSDKKRLESAAAVALAELRLREGKPAEAIELLEDERRGGDSGPLLSALGRARLAKGEPRSAIAAFESALRLDKNDPQLRLGLAEAHQKKGDVAAAIEALEPLTTGNLVVPRALVLLAELRALRGDERGAAELLERARSLDPDDPRVELGLGSTAYRLKRPEAEALEHYGRALELDRRLGAELVRGGDPVDAYFVGRLLLEKNEKRAIQLLETAVAAEDHPPEARYYLGKALLKRPRTRKQGLRELAQFKAEMPGSDLAEEAAKLIKGR